MSSLLFLSAALLLLWFPRRWMRVGKSLWRRRHRAPAQNTWMRRGPGDPRIGFWEEFGKGRNWVDLLRATAGSMALLSDVTHEATVALLGEARGLAVLAVQCAILFLGLLIQVVRREGGHGSFFAPVFYIAGTAVGLCGPWAAFFGFVLVWAVNPMLSSALGFLVVQALALGAFGILLRGASDLRPAVAALLCLTPALLSVMFRRPLVVFSRKRPNEGANS